MRPAKSAAYVPDARGCAQSACIMDVTLDERQIGGSRRDAEEDQRWNDEAVHGEESGGNGGAAASLGCSLENFPPGEFIRKKNRRPWQEPPLS
jgi:hypothetical protein